MLKWFIMCYKFGIKLMILYLFFILNFEIILMLENICLKWILGICMEWVKYVIYNFVNYDVWFNK